MIILFQLVVVTKEINLFTEMRHQHWPLTTEGVGRPEDRLIGHGKKPRDRGWIKIRHKIGTFVKQPTLFVPYAKMLGKTGIPPYTDFHGRTVLRVVLI